MPRRRYRTDPSLGMPWTEAEDQALREINAIGLSSDHWGSALPRRTFGQIAARRLDLGIKPAPLL